MDKTLLKYKIGLMVLFGLAVVVCGLVLVQAGSTKQDTKTNTTASKISDQLDNYVDTNSVIPDSLSQAGIHNVPSTINYQKLSDSSYKFCVTYKGSSSNFDAASAVSDLETGGTTSSNSSVNDNTELTIDPSYHKGANCQTIQPDITPSDSSSSGNSSSANLCAFGPVQASGCSVSCGASAQNVATVTDGTIANIGDSNITSFTITDSKNLTHTVTITANTKVYDSSCETVDASNMLSGDQVRIVTAGPAALYATANSQIPATEIDDLSY